MERKQAIVALRAVIDAYDEALTTHIYNADNGEHPAAEDLALVFEAREALEDLSQVRG